MRTLSTITFLALLTSSCEAPTRSDAGSPDGGPTSDAGATRDGVDAGVIDSGAEVGWDAGLYDGGVIRTLGMARLSPVENVGAAIAVLSWVTLEGVQNQPGPVAGLLVEAGYGPRGSSAMTGNWSWRVAPFAGALFDMATYDQWLFLPQGSWDVAMRFTLGPAIIYVDANQATPYSAAENGHVEVLSAGGDLDYCEAWFPDTLTLDAGTGALVYGRVYEAGLTTLGTPADSISSQVGQGPVGTDPRTAAGWTWHDGHSDQNYCCFASNDDEHVATLWAPLQLGPRSYAWRFRQQGGWTYCDTDGSGTNPGLNFDPASQGAMTVR